MVIYNFYNAPIMMHNKRKEAAVTSYCFKKEVQGKGNREINDLN